jgi:fucose 4-O-acetylase-like acetyltransferase
VRADDQFHTEDLLGIFFILALSKRLERAGWFSALFQYIGEASLIILIFQVPIQEYWGQKLLALTNSPQVSYWVSFLIGMAGPILINGLFIRPNPIVRRWFGQTAPKEDRQQVVRAFE